MARVMPYNIEAEQSVLGSILIDRRLINTVVAWLSADDFYYSQHETIYKTMIEICKNNIQVDLVTLSNRLTELNILDKVGGLEYLGTMADFVPAIANFKKYCGIVKGCANKRRMITALEATLETAYSPDSSMKSIRGIIEKNVLSIGINEVKRKTFIDALQDAYKDMQDAYENNGRSQGVSTGFNQFDTMTGGLQGGQLLVAAGRPGMGKTSFAINIAQHVASKEKQDVYVFSLEMSQKSLIKKTISSVALVDSQNIRDGKLNKDEWERIAASLGCLGAEHMHIFDESAVNIHQVTATCREYKNRLRRNPGLIVIDYLQLMDNCGFKEKRLGVEENCKYAKALAKEMDCTVILLSQLNRDPDSRVDKRPYLSDLRETGAIEQDADIVVLLYRDDYYDKNTEYAGIAEVNIAKHREGETGIIELRWMGQYTRFADATNFQET